MQVVPLKAFNDNYIWVFDINDNGLVCVDPGDAQPVLNYCQLHQRCLSAILLTHHHADHIGGVNKLKQIFPEVKIYGPQDARIDVTDEVSNLLNLGNLEFQVLATPGHTSSHICYYEAKKHWLFCGDTLFSAGCGRVFDGSMQELFNSLSILRKLPDETKIYCAHEYTLANLKFANFVEPNNTDVQQYITKIQDQVLECTLPSTIAMEKRINPFFRFDHPNMQSFIKNFNMNHVDDYHVFQALRLTKDNF